MSFNPLLILVGGMLITAPVVANEPAQLQAQPAARAQPSKLVCRMEAEIGSLSKKRRVCRAVRQRTPAGEASRDSAADRQASGSGASK